MFAHKTATETAKTQRNQKYDPQYNPMNWFHNGFE
jgi:hypothetical protein